MKKLVTLASLSCFILLWSCLDPYNAPSTKENLNYLVVDGFLNGSDKSCKVLLSRTSPLTGIAGVVTENGAQVRLEDGNGNFVLLTESKAGEYSKTNLTLNESLAYRILITTQEGKQYASDFVSVLNTPPIDDITTGSDRTGFPVYVSTHDPDNKTHYYQWQFTETWLYTSAFDAVLQFKDGKVGPIELSTYKCWQSYASTEILISTSKNLDEDIISNFNLTTVPWSSRKLSDKYSILVEQRSLTKEAYDYQLQLKKNTENLGTLFDPLPSRIVGNIKCITESKEFVLGYFNASHIEKKRFFIGIREIKRPNGADPIFTGYETCKEDTMSLKKEFNGRAPIRYMYSGLSIVGYYISENSCVDCRLEGGTNVKPDFWED